MFAFGCWAGVKMFLHEKGACQNGNHRLPCKVPGKQRSLLQGIAGSQKLDFDFRS